MGQPGIYEGVPPPPSTTEVAPPPMIVAPPPGFDDSSDTASSGGGESGNFQRFGASRISRAPSSCSADPARTNGLMPASLKFNSGRMKTSERMNGRTEKLVMEQL